MPLTISTAQGIDIARGIIWCCDNETVTNFLDHGVISIAREWKSSESENHATRELPQNGADVSLYLIAIVSRAEIVFSYSVSITTTYIIISNLQNQFSNMSLSDRHMIAVVRVISATNTIIHGYGQ